MSRSEQPLRERAVTLEPPGNEAQCICIGQDLTDLLLISEPLQNPFLRRFDLVLVNVVVARNNEKAFAWVEAEIIR